MTKILLSLCGFVFHILLLLLHNLVENTDTHAHVQTLFRVCVCFVIIAQQSLDWLLFPQLLFL